MKELLCLIRMMGTPQHYSRELPERCLRLIDELWPAVEKVSIAGKTHLGPLTTTFLLALATPAVVLPIERIERHFGKSAHGYVDDQLLDERTTNEVRRVFRLGRFERAPFFARNHWRFTSITYKGENLAARFPDDIAAALAAPEAIDAAAAIQVSEWASCLRNALAHGGVVYVDKDGRQAEGAPAAGFVFVSANYPETGARNPPSQLKLLRIAEKEFRAFLKNWIVWLQSTGLSEALAA